MNPSDYVDIVAFGGMAVGMLLGALRGLSGEFARIVSIFVACGSCRVLAPWWNGVCAGWGVESKFVATLLSVGGVLLIGIVLGWVTRWVLEKSLRVLIPQPLNAILGSVFGGAAMCFVLIVIAFCLHLLPIPYVRETLLEPARFWKMASPITTLASTHNPT